MNDPIFAKLAAVEDLSVADRSGIEALLRDVRTVPRRRKIVSDRDKPRHVHVVVDGWAARAKLNRQGGRRITGFLLPGDFFDFHVSTLAAMDHDIVALTDCQVAYLDPASVEALVRYSPMLARAMGRSTLIDDAILRQWLLNATIGAYGAVAHLFCELHRRMQQIGLAHGGRLALPLTQDELADAIAITPVHMNRTLALLRTAGLIELKEASLYIPDIDALEKTCDFDARYLHLRQASRPTLEE